MEKRNRSEKLGSKLRYGRHGGRKKAKSSRSSHDAVQNRIGDNGGVLVGERSAGPFEATAEGRPDSEKMAGERPAGRVGKAPFSYEAAVAAIYDMNKEVLEDYCRSMAIGFRDLRAPSRKNVVSKNRKRS